MLWCRLVWCLGQCANVVPLLPRLSPPPQPEPVVEAKKPEPKKAEQPKKEEVGRFKGSRLAAPYPSLLSSLGPATLCHMDVPPPAVSSA